MPDEYTQTHTNQLTGKQAQAQPHTHNLRYTHTNTHTHIHTHMGTKYASDYQVPQNHVLEYKGTFDQPNA